MNLYSILWRLYLIDKDRLKLINDFTFDLRKIFEIQTPIDLDKVIKKIGGTVVVTDWCTHLSESVIIKTGNHSFIIRDENDKADRNFRLAQGLGQLFLLYGYLIDSDLWDKIETNIPQNTDWVKYNKILEINCFAWSFLMPEEQFRNSVENNTENSNGRLICNTSKVAEEFGVSVSHASKWGEILGCFE